MKQIPLTQGQFALVDDEDYDWLMQWKWYAKFNRSTGTYYAARNARMDDGRRTTIRMHQQIMGSPLATDVDHCNHNTLDNRRLNLRACTHAQNMQNQPLRRDSTTKYKGVQWYPKYQKYVARIGVNGKRIFLGYFNTPEDAYTAYCAASEKFHGEFSYLGARS